MLNTSEHVIFTTPSTPLVSISGYSTIEIIPLAPPHPVNSVQDVSASIEEEIQRRFPTVGDLSTHPITPAMQALEVKPSEVGWNMPQEQGSRTPYYVMKGACRHKVLAQLERYIQLGYIREASLSEQIYLSPLLPIAKSDGSYRLVNDLRLINCYFRRDGTEQPSVWTKLWDVKSSWRFYVKIDLKDAFFSVPISEDLSRAFGFSWGSRRYVWRRLPQGFSWAPVLFSERAEEIMRGDDSVVYMDDILIGSGSVEELRRKTIRVFSRLEKFGLKVNYSKTKFCTDSVSFLGMDITDGSWSLKGYLDQKVTEFGDISHWKDLERLIGVLTYVRKTVPKMEEILSRIRSRYSEARKKCRNEEWWKETQLISQDVIRTVLDKQRFLSLPGIVPERFHLETDWSGTHASFILFAIKGSESFLVDMGSKTLKENTSSFLGEFKSLVQACKSTADYRGDSQLVLFSDNLSLVRQIQSGFPNCQDKRVLRLWGWLLANERFTIEFLPGNLNRGADLLSRPRISAKMESVEVLALTTSQRERIRQAHLGHWGWRRTLENLRKQGPIWRGAANDVRRFVNACPRCQVYGPMRRSPPWKAITTGSLNSDLFIDFLGPLQWEPDDTSTHVFVVIDSLSRYIQLSCNSSPTARASARGLQRWFSSIGVPHRIICDQAAAFTSHTFTQFCLSYHVDVQFVSAAAHWSLGVAERCIGTILGRIRRSGPTTFWPPRIQAIAGYYNNTPHSAVGSEPSTIMMGVTPQGRTLSPREHASVIETAISTTRRLQAKRAMKHLKNNPQRPAIVGGDRVMLRKPTFNKLEEQWAGPLIVDRPHGSRMYWLRDDDGQESGPWHAHQLKVISFSQQ